MKIYDKKICKVSGEKSIRRKIEKRIEDNQQKFEF